MAQLPSGTIAVLGEALIDLVETGDDDPRLARPGGSPYNVAIGLARLGRPAAFAGRISHDPLGSILRNHAVRSEVNLALSVDAHEPSTVALVELDAAGVAQYRFGVEGTADFRWTDYELDRIPTDVAALHFGSLTSWTPPSDSAVRHRIGELREAGVFVTYDPNVRPRLQPDRAHARAVVEATIPLAHLVKTSEEDIAWLYPDADPAEIAHHWRKHGPEVVVVTRGGEGSSAYTDTVEVNRPVRAVTIVDTVGAGDAFTSGLLDALAARDLLEPVALRTADADTLTAVLDHAALVAAITCSRAGANPPRRADLDAFA